MNTEETIRELLTIAAAIIVFLAILGAVGFVLTFCWIGFKTAPFPFNLPCGAIGCLIIAIAVANLADEFL